MATTLKAQLAFASVAAGDTATLPHNLNLNGAPFAPDAISIENPDFDCVSSTSTTVTVINNGVVEADCRILCELWHTIERVFGDGSKNLTGKPFISRGVSLTYVPPDYIAPYGSPALIYYVRTTGSDSNDGRTPATAFATLGRALRQFPIASVNQPIVIDITGMTISADEVLNLGGITLGGVSFDIDFTATSPNNFYSRHHRQLRSELTLYTALDVTGSSFNADDGILQLTVSNALVANELRDKFAVGAVLGEYGAIQSNTGGAGPNTVEVANIVGLTGPVGVYDPGATLQYGDAANGQEQAIYLNALCDWTIQGINIASNGPKAAAITVWPQAPVNFTLCRIAGMDLQAGPGIVTIDGCALVGQTFAQNGATCTVQQSLFRALSFLCHGSGASGLNEWIGNIIDGCNAFGGGNVESRYTYEGQNLRIVNGTGNGVQARFGVSRLLNSTINNCAASAVGASNPVALTLNNVTGTGNVGYGIEASYGAIVRPVNGTTVTGTINDTLVGAAGAFAYAALPQTDPDQLTRVGA
jgi:hypothetical protein